MGSLSVATILKNAGFGKSEFYSIDFLCLSFFDALDYIENKKPDIIRLRPSGEAHHHTLASMLALDLEQ
jgi:hypothetical protein